MRKRLWERIPLDTMGYVGGWAEVCINPSQAEWEAYTDAALAMSPKPLSADELADLSGPEMLERVKAHRPDDATLAAFRRSRMAVFGKVHLGDGAEWDLSSEDGYAAFAAEGDAQVTLLMQDEFVRRRNERLQHAAESFRHRNGASPVAGQGRSEVESAA